MLTVGQATGRPLLALTVADALAGAVPQLHPRRMDADPVCPRPLVQRDAEALIGVLAILEGEAMAAQLDRGLMDHMSRRFVSVGLLPNAAGDRELQQVLNDLNHRLRYALGEDDEPHVATLPRSPDRD